MKKTTQTKIHRVAAASLVAVSIATCAAGLSAQETRSSTLLTTEHWLDWERVSDAQISPDGARIVYTRQHVNALEDKWESEVWILNADGAEHRFFVKGSAARWSPDGKRLMYLAEGEPKGAQIFVRWIDANGPATPVTHVTESPRSAKWSPDGRSIAFSMFVPEQEKWSISMPAEPKGAKWTPAPRVVSSLHFRQDQVGFLDDGYTHLFVVPSDGGTARDLTPGKWSVGAGELRAGASIDWTPDSKAIVFDSSKSPDADVLYEASQLYVVDLASGTVRDLVAKAGNWGRPVVSPDGRTVAFTGHPPTGRSHTVSDLFVIPLTPGSGDMRKISGDFDRDPINMRWAPDGTGLYFRRGRQRCAERPVCLDRRRREDGDDGASHADVRLGVEGSRRGRDLVRSRSSAGRREVQLEDARPGDDAHRRERRRTAGQAARED
jgi:Tol biopolymer transport system component